MSRLDRELAAFADGSYEAPGLRERIAASPELQALVDEQRRAVAVSRAARPAAPPALRAAVAAGAPAREAARSRRPTLGLALAAAGVLALTVVAVLPGAATPSVAQVAALALRGPAAPAPAVDPGRPDALATQADGVRYPYWQDAFGYRSSGTRTDRIDGRTAMTVYYASAARTTVGYAIVGGPPLPEPPAAVAQVSGGTRYVGLTSGGRTIVSWRRAGHTCVISAGGGVPLSSLLRLAEWRYDATPA